MQNAKIKMQNDPSSINPTDLTTGRSNVKYKIIFGFL